MGLPGLIGLGVASLAVNIWGQYKAAKAQKQAAQTAATETERAGKAAQEVAEDVADLSDYNADVAKLQGQDAVERGAEAESRYRTQIRGVIGEQRAAQAAGNIDVSWGSAVDVQADAAYLGEMDALQIRTNAARESWGYEVQAEDYRRRGEITRKEGRNYVLASQAQAAGLRAQGNAAMSSGYLNMASTVLGGTSSLLMMKYGFDHGGGYGRSGGYGGGWQGPPNPSWGGYGGN